MIRRLIPDLLVVSGFAAVTTGLWWQWPWVALVIGGVLLLVAGLRLAGATPVRK